MALIVEHSQVKYPSSYLDENKFSVFSFQGKAVPEFLMEEAIIDVVPFFSVSKLKIFNGFYQLHTSLRCQFHSVYLHVFKTSSMSVTCPRKIFFDG